MSTASGARIARDKQIQAALEVVQARQVVLRDSSSSTEQFHVGYLRGLQSVADILFNLGIDVHLPDALTLGKFAQPENQISLGLSVDVSAKPEALTCQGPEALTGSFSSGIPC